MNQRKLSAGAVAIAAALIGGPALAQDGAHSFRQSSQSCGAPASYETAARQTAEVILPDGTSVVLSPGSRATVVCSAGGASTITVESGLVRVASGTGNQRRVTITTAEAELSLRGGAAIVEAGGGATRAHLIYGGEMVVSAGGTERLLFRPGFQVVADGGRPGQPRRMSAEALLADIQRLSEGLSEGTLPRILSLGGGEAPGGAALTGGTPSDGEGSEGGFDLASLLADRLDPQTEETDGSGGGSNSGGSATGVGDDRDDDTTIDNGSVDRVDDDRDDDTTRPPVTTPPPPPVEVPFDLAGSLSGPGGVSGNTSGSAGNVTETSTTTVTTDFTRVRQQFDDRKFEQDLSGSDQVFKVPVYLGPMTNRLFASNELAPGIGAPSDLGDISEIDTSTGNRVGPGYYYAETSSGLVSTTESGGGPNDSDNSDTGLVRLQGLPFGKFETFSFHTISEDNSRDNFAEFRADTTFGATSANFTDPSTPTGVWHVGKGVVVNGLNYVTDFPRGVVFDDGIIDTATPLTRRDNFMFLDMDILAGINWYEGSCGSRTECLGLFEAAAQGYAASIGSTFAVGSDPYDFDYDNGKATGAALIEDPNETRRYIFAAGGLDEVIANPTPGPTIDRFHIAAGMDGPVTSTSGIFGLTPGMHLGNGDRAFLRAETWTDLGPAALGFDLKTTDLTQSDFIVINPDAPVIGTGAETPKVLYADAATVTANGRQVSTISAAIGQVRFRFGSELNGGYQDSNGTSFGNEQIVDAVLDMRTIASSRGYDASGEQEVPTLIWSDFESTAAGGGNPRLGDGTTPDPGRMGFFVLENAGIVFDDVEDRGTLPGGTESPLGMAPDVTYAALRLGVATGSDDTPAVRLGFPDTFEGFAGAILDTESGATTTLSALGAPDLTMRLDPAAGLSPNLAFTDFDPVANTFSVDLAGLSLGGTDGQSVFIDDAAFGARTTDESGTAGSNVALIAGDLVAAGISPDLPEQARDAAGRKYDHVKWGFFFGDTDTGATSGTRTHAHLGSFAAGRLLSETEATQITRQANISDAVIGYRGHMVGNVLDGGAVRTATGEFSDTFDFASRTGTVTASFDNRSFTGNSAAPPNLQAYTGSISGGGLTGELNGRFIGPAETRQAVGGSDVLAPAGIVGAFSLSGGSASDYRAVGTFAAE